MLLKSRLVAYRSIVLFLRGFNYFLFFEDFAGQVICEGYLDR